jgi:hypothetical protein
MCRCTLPRSDTVKKVVRLYPIISFNKQFYVENSPLAVYGVKCVQHGCP